MMRNKLWTLLLLAVTSVVAFAQVPVIGSTIDAKTGFKNNGIAPSGDYLCGNGTIYVNSATPCGGILFYQTVDENGTAQTQRPALNFSAFFNLTDSTSPARTNVDAAQVGANATCTNPSSVTVDVYGRTTACANSTGSVLLSPNGYEVSPSGHIHEWGHAPDAGGTTITVTFPLAFPHAVFSVVATDNLDPAGSRIVSVLNFTTSTFDVHNNGTPSLGEYWQADGW